MQVHDTHVGNMGKFLGKQIYSSFYLWKEVGNNLINSNILMCLLLSLEPSLERQVFLEECAPPHPQIGLPAGVK